MYNTRSSRGLIASCPVGSYVVDMMPGHSTMKVYCVGDVSHRQDGRACSMTAVQVSM